MSHYEQRLEADIARIREHSLDLMRQVKANVEKAVEALMSFDTAKSYQTILLDFPVNRESRALDALCHEFVARHLPSAGHLRFISAVLRMNVSIERIGDYGTTICRLSTQLSKAPSGDVRREMEHLAEDAIQMFQQATLAFEQNNAELARSTRTYSSNIQRDLADAFSELVQLGDTSEVPTSELFALLTILNRLERVSDHAKNLCEYIDFAVTGQTKPPKRYRILFVGSGDATDAKLAVAYSTKAFGEHGEFQGTGPENGSDLPPSGVEFLENLGHQVSKISMIDRADAVASLKDYHVVVGLDTPLTQVLGKIPFHTVALEWSLPALPESEAEHSEARWRAIYQELASHVSELMMLLRGKEGTS